MMRMSHSLTSVLPVACDVKGITVVFLFFTILLHTDAATCPQPCLSGLCDEATGNCVVDWDGSGLDSVLPQVVKLGCSSGLWGGDCSEACPDHCANAKCEQDTGQCVDGCLPGYTGRDCSTQCTTGYHGNGCLVPCNEHCKNGTCDAQSGACDQGCLDGYWGSDCSLGVDFKRTSPLGKREFYENLSAQSKSVLLYLLTSRYDHALARAQFEIEQAVRDRNEIQNLLQD